MDGTVGEGPAEHPTLVGRARARTRGERGTTLVEAAFVTPIFLLLVMMVFEGGYYMKDYLGMANAARAGARSASAAGAQGRADLYTVMDVGREIAALKRSDIEYVVVFKANGPYNNGPKDGNSYLTDTCRGGTPVTGVCNVYRPSDFDKAEAQVKEEQAQAQAQRDGVARTLDKNKIWFGCLVDGPHAGASPDRFWCPGSRVDKRSGNGNKGPDFVGVYIQVRHTWLTKVFGTSRTMSDQSVIRIEPRQL